MVKKAMKANLTSTCSQTNAVLPGSVKIPCYDLVCYFLALPKQKVLCKTNLVTAAVLSLTCLSVNTFHCSPRVMKIAQSSHQSPAIAKVHYLEREAF